MCLETKKQKYKTGKFLMFSSKAEFLCIVTRLDCEQLASEEHLADEKTCDTYY